MCQVQSGMSRSPVAVRLSTWQRIAASCPTALGALCGQLMFRLAWCREHSAVTATELLQPLDLVCGTLFRSSCAIQTSPTDYPDDSWRDFFFRKHEHGALWLLICGALEKHLLTYLQHTYRPVRLYKCSWNIPGCYSKEQWLDIILVTPNAICVLCNNEIFCKLRNSLKYPIPYSRTKKYQSFLNYALANFQNSM